VYFVLGVVSSVPQNDLSLFGQVLPFLERVLPFSDLAFHVQEFLNF
jgi:hypothetical protein